MDSLQVGGNWPGPFGSGRLVGPQATFGLPVSCTLAGRMFAYKSRRGRAERHSSASATRIGPDSESEAKRVIQIRFESQARAGPGTAGRGWARICNAGLGAAATRRHSSTNLPVNPATRIIFRVTRTAQHDRLDSESRSAARLHQPIRSSLGSVAS